MAKKTQMPKDTNQRAAAIVAQATVRVEEETLPVLHLRWTMAGHSTRATPVIRLPLADPAR
jgi:prophage DNA circulation protein